MSLGVNRAEMIFDGAKRNSQFERNRWIGLTGADQAGDVDFATGKSMLLASFREARRVAVV